LTPLYFAKKGKTINQFSFSLPITQNTCGIIVREDSFPSRLR